MESQRVRHDSVTQQQHKISHALVTRGQKQSFERSLGQTYLLILESLLERQEATGAHPGDTDTGSSHCEQCVLPQGQVCRQAPF